MSRAMGQLRRQVKRQEAVKPTAASAASLVYERLRQDILALRLAPGSLIDRADLRARFGLSSTPVRDALIRLGEEGLVEIVAQSATRVSLIDIAQARQAQFLRRALEQEAVEVICQAADRSVLLGLELLLDDQRRIARDNDLVLFNEADRTFHRRLFEAANIFELHDMVRRRSGHIERIRELHLPKPGRMLEIVEDHEAILQAIRIGNAEAARRAVRDHLSQSLAYSPTLKELNPGYFDK
ncbi:MAG: GntR family transcriptional regulator [Bosea sp. (in: a-proteobacteria)]